MKNQKIERVVNPFIRIAGMQALLWGVVGLVVSTLLSGLSGYHYHGLLHFGPAPNSAWWCFVAEHLIVWLVPATLFYIAGKVLSNSQIRMIDVYGTVLFAQLPLIVMNLIYLLPPMQAIAQLDSTMAPTEILAIPNLHWAIFLSLFGLLFILFSLVWMFQALKVSCNLKQGRLCIVAIIGIWGGDALCRFLIGLFY